jgi:hypothetical protein
VASPVYVNAGRPTIERSRGFPVGRSITAILGFLAELVSGNGMDAAAGIDRLLRSTTVIPEVVIYPNVPVDAPRNMES